MLVVATSRSGGDPTAVATSGFFDRLSDGCHDRGIGGCRDRSIGGRCRGSIFPPSNKSVVARHVFDPALKALQDAIPEGHDEVAVRASPGGRVVFVGTAVSGAEAGAGRGGLGITVGAHKLGRDRH